MKQYTYSVMIQCQKWYPWLYAAMHKNNSSIHCHKEPLGFEICTGTDHSGLQNSVIFQNPDFLASPICVN